MDCVLVFCLLVWLAKTPSVLILLIGLTLNIVGSLSIAISVTFRQKLRIGYHNDDGKMVYVEGSLAKSENFYFKWGVYILIMGFIFQFIGVLLELILS